MYKKKSAHIFLLKKCIKNCLSNIFFRVLFVSAHISAKAHACRTEIGLHFSETIQNWIPDKNTEGYENKYNMYTKPSKQVFGMKLHKCSH